MNSAGKRYAERGKTSVISYLLNENADNYRRQLELRGIKPKNHHRANLDNIATIQKRAKHEEAVKAKEALSKNKKCAKYAHTESKLKQSLSAQKPATTAPRSSTNFMAKNRSKIQTQSTLNSSRREKTITSREIRKPAIPTRSEMHSARSKSESPTPSKDFLALNKEKSREFECSREAKEEMRFVQKKDYGKVPDYLIQRRLQKERAEQKELEDIEAAKIPKGMRKMTDEERQHTLSILAENRIQILQQIKNLPLVIETPSMRRREAVLNKQINECEKNIALFSKPTVFIALDE